MSKHYKDPRRSFSEPERLDPVAQSDPRHDPRIAQELEDHEELIWAGTPIPARMSRSAIPIMIFGIPWTAFSIFWILAASGVLFGGFGGSLRILQVVFAIFGLPFVLIGVGMLTMPYWARLAAKRTLYALTDRRCIIWQPHLKSMTVKSYGPDDLKNMSRIVRSDGSGDVIFVQSIRIRERHSSSDTTTSPEGFIAVPEVTTLERLIRDTLLSEFPVPGQTSY